MFFLGRDDRVRLFEAIVYHSISFEENYEQDYDIMILPLLAAEDRRGHLHHGVDFLSIGRSLFKPINGRVLRGVSTVEQQLGRTIYPRSGGVIRSRLCELRLCHKITALIFY